MMKLMKFLVVALVAGGVCAPALSQAEDNKLLLIKCTPDYYDPSFGERPLTMWFTINFERETVKSWTHNLKIGNSKGEKKSGHSYIDISDRLLEIDLMASRGDDIPRRCCWANRVPFNGIYIDILRLTGEWNFRHTHKEVLGRCTKMEGPSGQRMELHPYSYDF